MVTWELRNLYITECAKNPVENLYIKKHCTEKNIVKELLVKILFYKHVDITSRGHFWHLVAHIDISTIIKKNFNISLMWVRAGDRFDPGQRRCLEQATFSPPRVKLRICGPVHSHPQWAFMVYKWDNFIIFYFTFKWQNNLRTIYRDAVMFDFAQTSSRPYQ